MPSLDQLVAAALAESAPAPFWLDQPGGPDPGPPLTGLATADLAIVGAGFTGLWAAIQAKEDDPSADVVVLGSGRVGSASGHRVATAGSCRRRSPTGWPTGSPTSPTRSISC